MKQETKKCKHCQSEIDEKAKICPVCKKKQKGNGCLIAIIIVFAIILIACISMCSSSESEPTQPSSDNNTSTQTHSAPNTAKATYSVGETWIVDGQWEITINSVSETSYRNEYADRNPAAVYVVNYSYTNLGYTDITGFMDGLYLAVDDSVVDASGVMGYSYPGEISQFPQETPVGATCNAQACIGVDTPGNFTINISQYDGGGNKQSASFDITL